jgi:RNA polymerase sigma-70 factor (ECF subfamily)
LLSRLLDEHGRGLRLFAGQYCDSPEDVVQYALLQLARLPRAPERVIAWLYRVVRNRAVSVARSAASRRQREQRVALQARTWFETDYAAKIDASAAAQALGVLPEDQREIIVARIWGGLTFEQIARVVGCSHSAAHRRYMAGLDALREKLRSRCTEQTKSES